jgi:alpha-1,2-mannosyltransferase
VDNNLTETIPTEPLVTEKKTGSRFLALLVGAAIAAPCVAVSLLAINVPPTLTYLATTVIVVVGATIANVQAPSTLASLPKGGQALFALWLILSVGAVYRISSLAIFINEPSQTQYAFSRTLRPMDNEELTKLFYVKHNCSTCYLVAADLADQGVENVYDRKHYRNAEVPTPVHETIGETFNIDQYQYPPPFLLGPYAAYKTGLDFFQLRSLWFALSILLFVGTAVALTVWVCGWRFSPLWLLWPAVLIAPNSIAQLQIANAHVFMILISILAMLLFEKKRNALGGTLLAYAAVSKFFPGLLVVYLLARRKWTAVGWTVAASLVLCAATLVVFGVATYSAFLNHQLPAIASGKAFWFAFEMPHAMLENSSVMGLAYKLKAIGIGPEWDPKSTAKILTWVYTFFAIAVAVVAGLRHTRLGEATSDEKPQVRLVMVRTWVALLVLAQLRSPFLPAGYGNIAIMILIALLLTVERTSFARVIVISAGLCVFAIPLPLPIGPVSSTFDFVFSFLATILAIVLAALAATRRKARSQRPSETAVAESAAV